MENDGLIVLVPLTKKEYRDAKAGHIIQKRCIIKDRDCCVVISNHFVAHQEITHFLDLGFDIFPLDISEFSWWDIDRRVRYNMLAEYECGICLCIISQNMYHQLQKEREEENDNDRDRKAEENQDSDV